jgi:hypothetical protein
MSIFFPLASQYLSDFWISHWMRASVQQAIILLPFVGR